MPASAVSIDHRTACAPTVTNNLKLAGHLKQLEPPGLLQIEPVHLLRLKPIQKQPETAQTVHGTTNKQPLRTTNDGPAMPSPSTHNQAAPEQTSCCTLRQSYARAKATSSASEQTKTSTSGRGSHPPEPRCTKLLVSVHARYLSLSCTHRHAS